MYFPLEFNDINNLLAILSIILLMTSEFLIPSKSQFNFILEKKRIKKVTIILSVLFLITSIIRLYQLLIII